MSTIASNSLVTPEELERMPDAVAYELVDGQLAERNLGAESSSIAAKILGLLVVFLRAHRIGEPFTSEASYQCFGKGRKTIRRADVSVVLKGRLPGGRVPRGTLTMAPDLAVEVVSPNDTSEEVDAKALLWLEAGARLVWVVSPATQTVRIHRPRGAANGAISIFSTADQITGEDVLPGFTASVSEFFEL
jgi:Uma2 family endonuclease